MSADDPDSTDGDGDGSDSGGYVHVPGTVDGSDALGGSDANEKRGERSGECGGRNGADESERHDRHPEGTDREFDWRGWILVGAIVVAFVIAPVTIVLWPPDVGFRFAYLVLPMLPALLLAIVAVWATTRP